MNSPGRILIVDSDDVSRRLLHGELLAEGFDVTDAEHPEQAGALCGVFEFDILLLNIAARKFGPGTCRAIRSAAPGAAILVLGEFDDPNRKAEMTEAGADQCLDRPVHPRELCARARALLRRLRLGPARSDEAIHIGEITLDPEQRVVYKAGEPVRLTPKEFTLLHYLMTHAGVPITHSSLLEAVWGPEHRGRLEYLRIFMRQLRAKLDDNAKPRYLLTDSCIGYRFAEASMVPPVDASMGRRPDHAS